MINLFLKEKSLQSYPQRGAATLVMTVILLVLNTLLIIFAANFGVMQEKTIANQLKNSQAMAAADAGLEFGINYLKQNASTILANPVNGYIQSFSNSSTSNVSLANNSKYTIVYANPIANNYNLIHITSTGVSDDGTATRVVSQSVQFGSMLVNAPDNPLITKGTLSLGGSSKIINMESNSTIISGSTIEINGSAETVLSSGTSSTSSVKGSDVQENVSSIQSMSQNDFFATYFGVSSNTIQSNIAHYYTNNVNTNYNNLLNGLTGTSIWIEQTAGTAELNGTTTVGSADNPVILIVNGDLKLTGSVTIYGFVYVMGTTTTDILGNVTINGSMATADNLEISGSTEIVYSSSVLQNLQNQLSLSYYAKVPGTWKDF
ncbi:MAG: hypothetical protein A3E83_00395 [Gammaproteobacteria bacterium RIFCSPHIGHO2_12_FULL_41_20]|nr:MAG: hypothetical protein A3E83_00395 [Gammaproteobacteria bacterium RIFCSPHIGHO2_12_FULL_41_20]